ncbi:hypothetical protein WA026_000728 [Henosepilachna vigintioctopunctata]|uniref:Uncharacterized protein n=1 Tax=Henosepilachna vigintioctopunctata TaxID=420089 RepID=A0AAW1UYJ2_9CUCU
MKKLNTENGIEFSEFELECSTPTLRSSEYHLLINYFLNTVEALPLFHIVRPEKTLMNPSKGYG